MTIQTIILKPEGKFRINVEQNRFVEQPAGNRLTVAQVKQLNIDRNPSPKIPDMTVADFLKDLASQHNVNLTNIPPDLE